MLRRRARDAAVVGLLEGVVADQVRGHLSGEGDDGDRVHEGVLERRHQVGRRGPRGDQAHAHLAGGARVALGRVPGGRFMAYQDVAETLEVVQGVVDRQYRPPGQAEHGVHAFTLQRLQHDPRSRKLHSVTLLRSRALTTAAPPRRGTP